MVPDKEPKQFIKAPDKAERVRLTLINCPSTIPTTGPGDKCYRLSWEDPSRSPFDAPANFYMTKLEKAFADSGLTRREEEESRYCYGGQAPAVQLTPEEVQISNQPPDHQWRFSYTSVGLLPKCKKVFIRLCGGWCDQDTSQNKDLDTRAGLQVATDKGQLLKLENGTNAECAP